MATAKKTTKKAPKKAIKKAAKKAAKKPAPKPVKKAVRKLAKKAVKKATPAPVSRGTGNLRSFTRGAAFAVEKTTLDTVYTVNNSGSNITLEINIGDVGQTSNMTVMLDETAVVTDLPGDFPLTVIGTNTSLNSKKLSIVANVADTSRNTNLTSLTIHLRGGESPADFPLAKTVDEEGDSEDYLCLIEFFNPSL